MLTLNEIKTKILEQQSQITTLFPIEHLFLFGSFVTGEVHEKSDINFLIQLKKEHVPTLILRAKMKIYFEGLFHKECQIIIDREELSPSSMDARVYKHEIF